MTDEAKIFAHYIDYSETRLTIQTATMDALDSKAFAVLAVDIAIAAAVVTLGQDALGRHWWVALIAMAVATAVGLFSLKGLFTGPQVGANPEPIGTNHATEEAFLSELQGRLGTAVSTNETAIMGMRTRLAWSFIAFISMTAAAICVVLIWRGGSPAPARPAIPATVQSLRARLATTAAEISRLRTDNTMLQERLVRQLGDDDDH